MENLKKIICFVLTISISLHASAYWQFLQKAKSALDKTVCQIKTNKHVVSLISKLKKSPFYNKTSLFVIIGSCTVIITAIYLYKRKNNAKKICKSFNFKIPKKHLERLDAETIKKLIKTELQKTEKVSITVTYVQNKKNNDDDEWAPFEKKETYCIFNIKVCKTYFEQNYKYKIKKIILDKIEKVVIEKNIQETKYLIKKSEDVLPVYKHYGQAKIKAMYKGFRESDIASIKNNLKDRIKDLHLENNVVVHEKKDPKKSKFIFYEFRIIGADLEKKHENELETVVRKSLETQKSCYSGHTNLLNKRDGK
ncbi:hypothetical protein ACFLYA_02245 [Candidatus Dependentiae bacterium]